MGRSVNSTEFNTSAAMVNTTGKPVVAGTILTREIYVLVSTELVAVMRPTVTSVLFCKLSERTFKSDFHII